MAGVNLAIIILLSHGVVKQGYTLPDILSSCSETVGCYCYENQVGISADCSGSALTEVPQTLPDNTTELKISRTEITHIKSEDFIIYPGLTLLQITQNEMLYNVHIDAFKGISDLQELWLYSNNISSLPSDVFQPVPRLTRLMIHENRLDSIPRIAQLSDLTYLTLYSNLIKKVEKDSFLTCSKLVNIQLHENIIDDIEDSAFNGLINTTVLDLSNNLLSTLRSNQWQGLDILRELLLQENKIVEVPASVFSPLDNLDLLDLSSNMIATIDNLAFNGLVSLDKLDLDYNRLVDVPTGSFMPLDSLYYLDLRGNLFTVIKAYAFSTLEVLGQLFLGNMDTLLEVEINAFQPILNIWQLALDKNPNLTHITSEHLPDDNFPGLSLLYLSGDGFVHLEEDLFSNKPNLTRADIHDNPFHCDCAMDWVPRVIAEGASWANHWTDPASCPRCRTPLHLVNGRMCEMHEVDLTCDPVHIVRTSSEHLVAYLDGNAMLTVCYHSVKTNRTNCLLGK